MIFLPYQDILMWTLVLSFVSSVIYRVFNKPAEMRKIKEDMKFYRKKSKEAQKEKDTKKANEYVSEMMKLSQKQMRINMLPMFVSLGIVLLAFGFLSQTYGGVLVETASAGETSATGYFAFDDFNHSIKTDKISDLEYKVTIDANDNGDFADDKTYAKGELIRMGSVDWAVSPNDLTSTKMETAIMLPFTIPLVGWTYLNWLAWYILIFLMGASLLFRKLLGVE